ncbi:MAG: HAD family phosphatase [Patescibacteria group bacterium]
MPIRGIAFDLEGTVVNVETAHHYGHLATAAEFGVNLTLEEAYVKLPHFIGGPDERVCEDIFALLDPAARTSIAVGEVLSRDKYYYERLLATVPIETRPGFLEAFRIAQALGLKLAIGSLTPEGQAMTLLERSGLSELFDKKTIVLREHVRNEKPAPDVFLRTADVMGIDPRDQIGFEDSPRGVKALRGAGSKAIGMPVVIRPTTVAALVEAGVCRIFFDWREINMLALIENLS